MANENEDQFSILNKISLSRQDANKFISRKLLANSWHHFEEVQQGHLERECLEEKCSWEEAREVFETDVDGLNKFWAQYTGQTINSSVDNPVGLIIGIVFGVAAFIILLIFAYVFWSRRKSSKEVLDGTNPSGRYPTLHYYTKKQGSPVDNNYETPLLDKFDSELAMGLSECYVERERLRLDQLITSGNFGDIWKGELRMRDNAVVAVAVKSLKHFDDPEDIEKFLREGVMMRGLSHKHVLSLYGVCLDSDVEQCHTSPLIILPFMKNGDLRTFLRDGNNVLTVLHLIRFCHHVALGMEYLAEKKFVHRDLAARNCMVDENWRVKVADFGLSRDLYDRDYYKSNVKTQLPLKWMSPESIKYGRYEEKSDVWSFGIVCWEIMTRGAIPYPTVQAVNILEYLKQGKRMDRPECCPYKLYSVMEKCWLDDSVERPTFEELVRSTSDILQEARHSVRRKKRATEASSNPYENSNGVEQDDTASRKPRPKPRDHSSTNQRRKETANDRRKDRERSAARANSNSRSSSSMLTTVDGAVERTISV